jgi:hypothetical protein
MARQADPPLGQLIWVSGPVFEGTVCDTQVWRAPLWVPIRTTPPVVDVPITRHDEDEAGQVICLREVSDIPVGTWSWTQATPLPETVPPRMTGPWLLDPSAKHAVVLGHLIEETLVTPLGKLLATYTPGFVVDV